MCWPPLPRPSGREGEVASWDVRRAKAKPGLGAVSPTVRAASGGATPSVTATGAEFRITFLGPIDAEAWLVHG